MLKKFIIVKAFIFFLLNLCYSQSESDSCIIFSSPATGSIISIPACTLSVQNSCNSLKNVEFQALYYTPEADTPIVKSLSVITRRPYTYVWNITEIPNQYYTGVEFIAIATLYNNKKSAIKRDGVFFIHNPVSFESAVFSYEYPGTKLINGNYLQLPTIKNTVKISANFYWNEKEVSVILDVRDPLFYVNISHELLSSMGLEILIDPSSSRKPYPDKNILMYVIPLWGKPLQVIYNPSLDKNGNYTLTSTTHACDFDFSVTKEDFKGFSILFSIPKAQFNSFIPESLTCNIISKTLDEKNEIIRTSWVQTNHIFESYSPILWGSVQFLPKPLIKSRLFIFGSAFLIGLLSILLLALLLSFLRKPHRELKFERNETDQQLFENIKTTFENKVIQKDYSVEKLAKELNLTNSKLNSHIKKLTGMSSQNYLMYCRVEIAKERLRSSHWSEVAIAEASGFENATQMEKYFIKFNRITPFKFRQQQQVS